MQPASGTTALPRPARAARLFGSPVFWVGLALVGFLVPIVSRVSRPAAPPLPVLGTLPAFALTAEDGKPFGSDDLRGRVWMAGFIFTRCPTICPAITAKMAVIQKRARGIDQAFRMVSFSVDPGHDTPAVLSAYAHRHKASPRIWKFLTGPLDAIRTTVVDGMKIAVGEPQGDQDFASLMHGTHFVLVDAALQIRGYYDSSDPDVADKVLHDAAMLINRGN